MKYGEPWTINREHLIRDRDGFAVTGGEPIRIVACVNACAGLDLPDDVPAGALAELVAAAREYAYCIPIVSSKRLGDALAKLERSGA